MTHDPAANLPNAADLCADLPDMADMMLDLLSIGDVDGGVESLDDTPDYDSNKNPEIDPHLRLSKDRAHLRTPTRRLFRDYRANPAAYRHLDLLPTEGESLHMVISGKYALWDLAPAILERTGDKCDEMYLATLGFSKQNGADMCGLLDDGHIKILTLIPSHYFKSTSGPIYDAVVPEVLARNQRVYAIRNHAKLILMRMTSGACYVAESSANLRSCVNIETVVLTR